MISEAILEIFLFLLIFNASFVNCCISHIENFANSKFHAYVFPMHICRRRTVTFSNTLGGSAK